MSKDEIKELFNKYDVKDLNDKNGQSECYFCKNIKHRFSLTWTSFLYEYKEHYYCYDCLLNILLQQENEQLKNNWNKLKNYIVNDYYMFLPLDANTNAISTLINKMQELERGVSDVED